MKEEYLPPDRDNSLQNNPMRKEAIIKRIRNQIVETFYGFPKMNANPLDSKVNWNL